MTVMTARAAYLLLCRQYALCSIFCSTSMQKKIPNLPRYTHNKTGRAKTWTVGTGAARHSPLTWGPRAMPISAA